MNHLNMNQQVEFLAALRNARALVLRDAESFHEASTVLEHLGQVLAKKVRNGLGAYEKQILDLADRTQRHDRVETARLFMVVREARNKAVHEGAWARHLSSRLVDLFLILEEAIMKEMQYVEDLMVRDPVTAQPWHLVVQARKAILSNSFSSLPIFCGGEWKLLTDVVLMRFLRDAKLKKDGSDPLFMELGPEIKAKRLVATKAVTCHAGTALPELVEMMNAHSVLITDKADESRLLGIITPFDLL